MNVYSVEERVDLGNHVVSLHFNRESAQDLCDKLNEVAQNKFIKGRTYYEVNEYEVEQ